MKATIIDKTLLSNKWGEYAEYTIDYQRSDGRHEVQVREIQSNGDGAAVLLYSLVRNTVILIRQFRLATMVNGNEDGVLVEVCAGLVERSDAEYTIKKEIQEETGYQVDKVQYLCNGYATPGAKTEMIYYFGANVDGCDRLTKGGGRLVEQEDIEVIEMPFETAVAMIFDGTIKDSKTILLLFYAKSYIFKD